ncbi:MAG: hypothetical protein IJO52_04995 [Clostridia bacterium]|nr:hypothetical protein [Clostridia bacterium]
MTYIPLKKPQKALKYQLVLLVSAVIFAIPSVMSFPYKWVFQLCFVVCAGLIVRNIVRYFMYEYKYVLTDKYFVVVQKCGKKEESVCDVPLCDARVLLKYSDFKKEKKKIGQLNSSYDYTQNFMPDEKYCFVFEFNHSLSCVMLEMNEEFYREFIKSASFCAETDISSWQE